ncbi:MAG: galactitol-1-phosphate 5-dehydrogenase [Deltaproteobacteria bacterium]|nr:galactitol-1-phosphate 5-dehydrogenase [Deltaproteobacteria bacterium]MBW1960726.1 galactitol-1-phosphate 5-dehydrogenase [Deltaproteobacteria bacterium]MBW2151992.1 galactitol-1-phosphate 5-dehydrogenase [Deltaproteobacteria bacterium]
MKALILKEYNRLSYEEVADPEYGPNDVLVQVKACGICGSDVHGMDGSTGRRIPPLIMGHEASGVIEAVGGNVTGWVEGDRVTFDSTIYPLEDWYTRKGQYNLSDGRMVLGVSCGDYRRHGAFAEYVVVPEHILYRIPENVSFEQAAMVEPVAVALHAINLTPISLNDSAVVVGAGMIGTFIIQQLNAAGCGKIIAIDIEQEKLNLALTLGATAGLNPNKCDVPKEVFALTGSRGADIAFEAVGSEAAVNCAIHCVRKGAVVTVVGNTAPTVNFPVQQVVTRELRLQGSCAVCGEYEAVLDMIENGKVNTDVILSATAPLSEGPGWFKRLYKGEKGLMKVILKPS